MVRVLKRVSNVNRPRVRITTEAADGAAAKSKTRKKPLKNKAAVALGKLGGRKGGLARAKNLTAGQRSAIAKKAAQARWTKSRKPRAKSSR
jgi:hypothetical protein